MARKRTQEQQPQQPAADEHKDPNHGVGGSYVNGEDGVRRLVERAEGVDRVPAHIPHEPPAPKDDEAEGSPSSNEGQE